MKRVLFLIILMMILIGLFAKTNYVDYKEYLKISWQNQKNAVEKANFSKTVAFPAENVSVEVEKCLVEVYTKDMKLIDSKEIAGIDKIEVVKSFKLREMFGHQINFKIKQENQNRIEVIKDIVFKLKPKTEIKDVQTVSSAFLPIYQDFADNFQSSYLSRLETNTPKMLILTHDSLIENLNPFTRWKNQCGIATEVVTLAETGNSTSEIKDYLSAQYNSDSSLDYFLIIGDVDDSYEVPSYYITEENDVTDQIYGQLDGDDYFPDIHIGRLSIDNANELDVIINKILFYEKNPYMENTDWFKKALVVAGNYSVTPPIPSTPVNISKWMADKMYNYGYENVDEIYYPPTYPGTSQIMSSINSGVSVITYRGWGDANGWHYPEYHVGEGSDEGVIDLNNGFMLPIVASIVCNTGDFANQSQDPCFGEAWIRTGSTTIPNGGVVFVGPSDLDTDTEYNNAIYSGIFTGILDEDIMNFGTAVLRGKIELYENFPLDQEPGDWVEFYFDVYNILGDPSLSIWTDVPQIISCDLPDEISMGTNNMTVQASDVENATVSIIQNNELLDVDKISDGQAGLIFNLDSTEQIEVTITKPNYKPFIQTIDVITEAVDIGLNDYQTDDEIIAGNEIEISTTLHNYGTQNVNNISGTLMSENPWVTILAENYDYGNIEVDQSVTGTHSFEISAECPVNQELLFDLQLSTGDELKFALVNKNLIFEVTDIMINDADGFLSPGETSEVSFSIQNISNIAASGVISEIELGSDAASVTSNSIVLGDIGVDETVTAVYEISLAEDCFVGRDIVSDFNLEDDIGRTAHCRTLLTVGEVDNTAPTGPDNYGYFAYDSNDQNYDEAPTYEWVEIDPAEGGDAEVIEMGDDASESIPLPFNFTYYGEEYDSLTVCSNGWISFVTTDIKNFRNWNIPGSIGPYAMVAAFWDDLIGANEGDEPMRVCHYYDEVNDRFIIEWNDCYNREDNVTVEKFEIILLNPDSYPTQDGNGEIIVNYHTVENIDSNDNYATVGIENHTQQDGVLYSYADIYPMTATELTDNLAIKFTTDAPDSYTGTNNNSINKVSSRLISNIPNPFNPETTIFYKLANRNIQSARINIFNLKGQKVNSFDVSNTPKNIESSIVWKGEDSGNNKVGSGIYFYVLSINGRMQDVKKCLLLK